MKLGVVRNICVSNVAAIHHSSELKKRFCKKSTSMVCFICYSEPFVEN